MLPGLRRPSRDLGFSCLVILILALALGANTATFTIIDLALLHPLPFADLDRLVAIDALTESGAHTGLAPADFASIEKRVAAFEGAALWRWQNPLLTGISDPQQLTTMEITAGLFELLRAHAALGRTLFRTDFETSAPNVVVISDRLWRQQFFEDPKIPGKQIVLDGVGYTVVGVMGPDFFFDRPAFQAWYPYKSTNPVEDLQHHFSAIARLRPSATIAQAQRQIEDVTLPQESSSGISGRWRPRIQPFTDQYSASRRKSLLFLWPSVALVLLIACANAASLLLTRASRRHREYAIRTALGASRFALTRSLLLEHLTLAAAAGIVGTAFGYALLRALAAAFPQRLPIADPARISLNAGALELAVALVALTTILCSVPSLWLLLRSNITRELASTARSSRTVAANRTHSLLVTVEVVLSVALLTAAGLLVRSLDRMLDVDLGFHPESVLTAQVAVPPRLSRPAAKEYYRRMLDETRGLPGVRVAATMTPLPFGMLQATTSFSAEGEPPHGGRVDRTGFPIYFRVVSPDFQAALGIRLLEGRSLATSDTPVTERVALVNRSLARHFWQDQRAVGKRVSRADNPTANEWLTVVGVVDDIRDGSFSPGQRAELYLPYTQEIVGARYTSLVVRTDADPASLAGTLRRRIHQLNPDQPVTEVKPMRSWVNQAAGEPRFHTSLLGIFAATAWFLAISGLVATVSYAIAQRKREIGIRGALGASPSRIAAFVLALGLRPVLAGLVAGIPVALAVGRALGSQLFQISPGDPLVLAAVPVIYLITALCAIVPSAARAARTDPVVTLRAE